VRLGIVTPVVTLLPRAHARWEETGTADDVVAIAQAADRLGFHHLTCSEHVAVPTDVAAIRGGRYWDPAVTLGFLAAHTATIRLATHVLVLGYHHPLEIAKQYGTLDVVSGGRLILGVGVGSLREEFDLLGAPFDDRGPRADDALATVRAALSRREPEAFPGWIVDPCAVQDRVPIWVGGRTPRSLRRAVTLADGWAPFGFSVDELAELLRRTERPGGFEVVLAPEPPVDPSGAPEATAEQIRVWTDAGATILNLRFMHHSPAHYVEQLEAMVEVAARA
jgi:probable F420-dependent oxidoreductase